MQPTRAASRSITSSVHHTSSASRDTPSPTLRYRCRPFLPLHHRSVVARLRPAAPALIIKSLRFPAPTLRKSLPASRQHPSVLHISLRPQHTKVTLRNLYPLDQPLFKPAVMAAVDASELSLDTYTFPSSRLRRRIISPDRTPLVLIACGSFSPITFLHLRMFEMAADYARFNTNFEVVGAYLSCVGDAYKKTGLVKAEHRVNMCNLAVQQSSWISVDPWEPLHAEYLETAKVLDHFNHEINEVFGGIETPVGKKKARIALLAGADLIQTMSTPGVWAQQDIDYILRNFGAFIVERTGTDIDEALSTLQPWKDNIWVIQQLVQNDISSTKIRLFRRRDMSIRYLVPEPVVQYIENHNLYDEDGTSGTPSDKGKGRQGQAGGSQGG